MKRILFVTDYSAPRRRLASDLCKVLGNHYACDAMILRRSLESEAFNAKYALIFASPSQCMQLQATYGISYDKMIAFAQVESDIFPALQYMQDKLRGFAVTAPLLQHIAFSCGITRIPAILPVGIFCANYAKPAGDKLQRLTWLADETIAGYYEPCTVDISRFIVGVKVAAEAGMTLAVPPKNFHFLVTEALYKSGDLGIFCSLIGTPYAALEAFASGVPVLGTETGIFSALAKSGGGGPLPFDEHDLVANAVEVIGALRANPELYQRMSAAALAESQKYDWPVLQQSWLEFLQNV